MKPTSFLAHDHPDTAPLSRPAIEWEACTCPLCAGPRWLRGRWRQGQLLSRQGRGRLLDFGCGNGAFLVQMQEAGWQVTGLDCSAATVRKLRDLGLSALEGSLPHPELQDESFDVIT